MTAARRPLVSWSLAVLPAVALVATVGSAEAGPHRKRTPAPRPELTAAVATGDPVTMCRAAIAASAAGEHARASLVLPACDAAVATAPELADGTRTARIAIGRAAERDSWSPVELVVRPAGADAHLTIDAFPGLPVTAGSHRLPPGHYRVTARTAAGLVGYDLTVADGSRALILVELPAAPAAGAAGLVDFTDDQPTAPMAGPPPVIRHGSLLPERYLRGLGKSSAKP